LTFGDGVPVTQRALVFAGSRQDDVEGAKRVAAMLSGGQRPAYAIDGQHAWFLKSPELLVGVIEA
jgi:hypothetical protein